MKRRMSKITGLGSSEPDMLPNNGRPGAEVKEFMRAASEQFFEGQKVDWRIGDSGIVIGIEPAYQYDPLKLIGISRDKNKSFIATGIAFGYYGSGIRKSERRYGDYKRRGKFVKFVDQWHGRLFK